MLDITLFINQFSHALSQCFGSRVWFAGLQGSRARGEATDKSDIDLVVILDKLTKDDIRAYGAMLDCLPHRDLICGFISGKDEILSWEASDLLQFYYDTKPITGSLDQILALIDDNAVDRAIKTGACNIYHGCVHNMLHEKSEDALKALYKSAAFVIQAICFRQSGKYTARHQDLATVACGDDLAVIRIYLDIKSGAAVEFSKMSETLFAWAQKLICKTK